MARKRSRVVFMCEYRAHGLFLISVYERWHNTHILLWPPYSLQKRAGIYYIESTRM